MIRARLAAVLAIAATIAPAHAAIVGYNSDAGFLASGFASAFAANVRWGNDATNGDWEFSVVDGSDMPFSGAQRQLQWSGTPSYTSSPNHRYEFVYNVDPGANNDDVSLALSTITNGAALDTASTHNQLDFSGINSFAVRARTGPGDVVQFQNLRVSFQTGGFVDLGGLSGDADAEYVVLIDDRLAGGFRLTIPNQSYGTATLQDGSGSLPSYQLKVGITPVPVLAALPLLLAGLGVLGVLGWRRDRAPR